MAITPGGRVGDASPLGKGPRKLSDYEREVAHALMRRGIPKERAIPMARGIINRAATTGRWGRGKKASPNVVAGAVASVAQRKAFVGEHKLANEPRYRHGWVPLDADHAAIAAKMADPAEAHAALAHHDAMMAKTPARHTKIRAAHKAAAAIYKKRRQELTAQGRLFANSGATITGMDFLFAVLDKSARDALATSEFAIPETRSYPIPDAVHARVALAMVKMHGTPEEQAKVRAAVKRKFPQISMSNAVRDLVLAEAAERGIIDLGRDGAKWKHGWIPLNAVAAAIKAKKFHGGKASAPNGKSRINVSAQVEHSLAPKGKARMTAAQRARGEAARHIEAPKASDADVSDAHRHTPERGKAAAAALQEAHNRMIRGHADAAEKRGNLSDVPPTHMQAVMEELAKRRTDAELHRMHRGPNTRESKIAGAELRRRHGPSMMPNEGEKSAGAVYGIDPQKLAEHNAMRLEQYRKLGGKSDSSLTPAQGADAAHRRLEEAITKSELRRNTAKRNRTTPDGLKITHSPEFNDKGEHTGFSVGIEDTQHPEGSSARHIAGGHYQRSSSAQIAEEGALGRARDKRRGGKQLDDRYTMQPREVASNDSKARTRITKKTYRGNEGHQVSEFTDGRKGRSVFVPGDRSEAEKVRERMRAGKGPFEPASQPEKVTLKGNESWNLTTGKPVETPSTPQARMEAKREEIKARTGNPSVSDFKVGQKITLDPEHHLAKAGAPSGTVVKVGRTKVHMKADSNGVVYHVSPMGINKPRSAALQRAQQVAQDRHRANEAKRVSSQERAELEGRSTADLMRQLNSPKTPSALKAIIQAILELRRRKQR